MVVVVEAVEVPMRNVTKSVVYVQGQEGAYDVSCLEAVPETGAVAAPPMGTSNDIGEKLLLLLLLLQVAQFSP